MDNQLNHQKTCVGIAAIVGAANLLIVTLLAIFSPSQLSVAAWLGVPLCFMGVALGYLALKR